MITINLTKWKVAIKDWMNDLNPTLRITWNGGAISIFRFGVTVETGISEYRNGLGVSKLWSIGRTGMPCRPKKHSQRHFQKLWHNRTGTMVRKMTSFYVAKPWTAFQPRTNAEQYELLNGDSPLLRKVGFPSSAYNFLLMRSMVNDESIAINLH